MADSVRGAVVPLLAVGGLVLALPLVLTHWHPSLGARVTVGLGVAVMWTLVNAVRLYSQV